MLIQEFNGSIVFKRYARCTNENLNNILFDKNMVCAHWIYVKKVISYRTYQGKRQKSNSKIVGSLCKYSKCAKNTSLLQFDANFASLAKIGDV